MSLVTANACRQSAQQAHRGQPQTVRHEHTPHAGLPGSQRQSYADLARALTYELMRCGASDYSRDVGTAEWLAENGWASEEEIERFMKAVLHSRCDLDAPGGPDGISPAEAESFVRRLLLRIIRKSTSVTSRFPDPD